MVLAFSPPSPDDVDGYLATLRSGECLPERALRRLCAAVSELMIEESNVQPVRSPVTVSSCFCVLDVLMSG